MAINNKQVYNLNNLSGNSFVFSIERFPNVTFTVQEVNLPGVQSNPKATDTPIGTYFSPGDHLRYSPLVISFIVDESLNNWREIYNWLRELSPTHIDDSSGDYSQYAKLLSKGITSTCKLTLLTNNLNVNVNVTIYDLFPTSLSDLKFSVTENDNRILTASVYFYYTYYDLEVNPDYNEKYVENNKIV